MGEVINERDYFKSNDRSGFDEYLVRFSIKQEGGFWTTIEESYYTIGKNRHRDIERQWKLDYREKEADLISIIYV